MSKMSLREETRNIFTLPSKYYLAHAISADYELGAGIAKEFDQRFNLKAKLNAEYDHETEFPDCILIDNIFNLVTKLKYHQKPSYLTIKKAIIKMNELLVENSIQYLALPLLGCGMDGLEWRKVRKIITVVCKDTECEILVCHKPMYDKLVYTRRS